MEQQSQSVGTLLILVVDRALEQIGQNLVSYDLPAAVQRAAKPLFIRAVVLELVVIVTLFGPWANRSLLSRSRWFSRLVLVGFGEALAFFIGIAASLVAPDIPSDIKVDGTLLSVVVIVVLAVGPVPPPRPAQRRVWDPNNAWFGIAAWLWVVWGMLCGLLGTA